MVVKTALRIVPASFRLGRSVLRMRKDHHLKKLAKGLDPEFKAVESNIGDLTSRALKKLNASTEKSTALVAALPAAISKEETVAKKSRCHSKCNHKACKLVKRLVFFGALAAGAYYVSQKLFGKPTQFPPANDNQVTGEDNPGGGNYVFNTSTQPE
ncbi:MAG: hypothetical protein Q3962_04615 [Corynebacterium sp.]|nr:hypothetical protein [Corynebacterium sp.]